jgi:hypothetical protein
VSTLNKLRDLNLFDKNELSHFYALSIRRKLWKIFGPDVASAAPKVKQPPKQPRTMTRVPVIERRIALGVELLRLKANSRRNNDFRQLRRQRFSDIDPVVAMEAARVAKLYGDKPDIYRRISWRALTDLCSPSLLAEQRERFEARILAGEDVKAAEIGLARARLPGRPRRQAVQPARQ